MKSLFRYWYVLVLALVLSIVSAGGLIYLRKAAWIPTETAEEGAAAEGEYPSFREWQFSASELEDLQDKFEAELAGLKQRASELDRFQAQIRSERSDLLALRDELEALRKDIQQDFIEIEESERVNLRSLASMYTEMKAPAAVKVFSEMETETVVKILTLMPSDASARILGAMADGGDALSTERAAEITNAIRTVKH